jgi:hypothetical protein
MEVGNPEDFKEEDKANEGKVLEPVKTTFTLSAKKETAEIKSRNAAVSPLTATPKIAEVVDRTTKPTSKKTKNLPETAVPQIRAAPKIAEIVDTTTKSILKETGLEITEAGTHTVRQRQSSAEPKSKSAIKSVAVPPISRSASPLIDMLKLVDMDKADVKSQNESLASAQIETKDKKPLIVFVDEPEREKVAESSNAAASAKEVKVVASVSVDPSQKRNVVAPASMFEFERDWKECKGDNDKLYQLIKVVFG